MPRASLPLICALVFFVACFCGGAREAYSAALFTVDSVQVDVTADNALQARTQAFDLAQRKAFAALVDRLAPDGRGQEEIDALDISVIASMIKDYEIVKEKISNVRYVGVYTFRFRSSAVKDYFSGRALNYTDMESDPVLILPFYQVNGRYDLWSYGNLWKSAWDRVNGARSLVPTVVPVGDLQDVSDLRDDQALTYDVGRLRDLVDRYGAKEAVIAVAMPDSGLIQSLNSGGPEQGALIVNLYRTDSYSPIHAVQFYVKASGGESVFDQAVKKIQSLLRENWKAQTMVNAGQRNFVQVYIPVSSLQDWIAIENKLSAISAVDEVRVNGLSASQAHVSLMYEGDVQRLQMALGRQGMKLEPVSADGSGAQVFELKR